MKISIKTKYDVIEVDADDVLHLVVPCKFTKTRIVTKTKAVKEHTLRHQVQYWCNVTHGVKGKSFATLEKANAFLTKVTYDGDVTRDVIARDAFEKKEFFQKFYRLRQVAIDYPHQDVPVDPYTLGLWLGDGTSLKCEISTADQVIVDYIKEQADKIGFRVVDGGHYKYSICPREGDFNAHRTHNKDNMTEAIAALREGVMMTKDIIAKYHVAWKTLHKFKDLQDEGKYDEYFARHKVNPITKGLKDLGVWGNKHIPELYLKNSREVRMQVLAGVIDSDGHMMNGGYNMAFASWRLLEDVRILATSLGFLCSPIIKDMRSKDYEGKPRLHRVYRSRISGGPELHTVPCLLPRKRIESRTQRFDQLEFELAAVP